MIALYLSGLLRQSKPLRKQSNRSHSCEPRGTAQSHQDKIMKKDEFGGSQWYKLL
jgi:hypothetical protein